MRSVLALPLFLAACSAAPSQDVFGGGTMTLTLPDAGPVFGTHTVPGATQDCLDTHGRDYCTDPHLELSSYTEGGTALEGWHVEAWLPLEAAEIDMDCFNGAPVELSVFLVQYVDEDTHDFWFNVEDPILAANQPNADQGGSTDPTVRGSVELAGSIDPSASGEVSGELVLSGTHGCEVLDGETVSVTLAWDFDPTVTAGPGILSLD